MLIVVLISNLSIAQKQFIEKSYNTVYENDCKEITINTGKPVFVVIHISNFTPNDSLIALREYNELKKNFKECNFYFLQKKGKIKLNNSSKQILDLDEVNSSYEKIIYWKGKKDSDFLEYDKLVQSSEFFSEHLKKNKKSSYIDNYNAQIYDLRKQLVWEPNESSKTLSDKYILNSVFNQLRIFDNLAEFLNLDFKGVKKLVVNSSDKRIKNPWQEIFFNKQGLPTNSIITSDDSDGKKGTVIYEYKDDLLSKITVTFKDNDGEKYEYSSDFYYFDSKLIVVGNSGVMFYTLNLGFLTFKNYYPDETNFDFLIDTYNVTNTNELKYIQSSGLNNYTISFNSIDKKLPVVYTLRPEAKERNRIVSVLNKIDNLNYTVTSKNIVYKKIKYFNKNLISEVLLADPDDISKNKKLNQTKFDFKYEYYK